MPQFDFYSFSSQVFWILIGFFIFYFFILKYYLVFFIEIYKMRIKLIGIQKFNQSNTNKNIYGSFFFKKKC